MSNAIQQYIKLENRLVLLAWLNSLLGYRRNRDLLDDTKEVGEGFSSDGHSHLYHHLIARGGKMQIPEADLVRYDANVRAHLEGINRNRPEPITLRYFQHLAALYAEIFLDRIFHRKAELLADLNALVVERNAAKLPGEPQDEPFSDEDLNKLAYWMATGSGKTLIMHLNYRQFLHYNREPLDNILLITPNEGLSQQHLAELAASGIPAQRFDLNTGSLWVGGRALVKVLEITKLVEQKRGGGVSVPVEAFEGRNLIFVDEGHKGSGGEVWRGYRDALGETGFTFEYSATFGQALSAARDDPLTTEYGKAIVFDYSYRYFYGDGFGKDFRILNLKGEERPEDTEVLLLGNMFSFYEQLRFFADRADVLQPYNLEKPLWVFVGSTVKSSKQRRSDILVVARFLHHVLQDRRWAVATIKKLLDGKSGLQTQDGQDVFLGCFPYLRELSLTPSSLYNDLLARIFHTHGSGGLHLVDIRGHEGEIGLKAANADAYFGLIYIGDTSAFKKLVEDDSSGIALEDDALSGSLFEPINRPDSLIHILIGAKKFMEGWNSWRVSNMGLLNIGRQEGSQIIQLFGRGVRLRGMNFSLKRSAALTGDHPKHLKPLETLNIFAVRANYMAQFRDYLEREGVETEPAIELPLFTWINKQALSKKLVVPRLPEGKAFTKNAQLILEPDEEIQVRVDLSMKVHAMESAATSLQIAQAQTGEPRTIPEDSLALVDWEQAYFSLTAHKARKGYHNLVIRLETPRDIIEKVPHILIADESVASPKIFSERGLLQEAVEAILCKYTDIYYRRRRDQWETQVIEFRSLDEEDPNLSFKPEGVSEERAAYVVKVPRSEEQLVEAIQELLDEAERLYQQESKELPRIHFDRHLYLPLLVEQMDKFKTVPPALKPSEAQFVRDLKDYWEAEKLKSLAGKEVFLLRNLSKGYGIGFFEESFFYPDFILWVLDGEVQRIIFVEPHGMVHAKAYKHDKKARLHERLPDLARGIGARSRRKDVSLDSFIISVTPFDELHERYDDGKWDRKRFAEKHILFPERNPEYDYINLLFEGS
jgi:hypothetical protein